MESVEMSGKTVDEAIERALAELGRSRAEVEITVLSEGRSGVLGIGTEEARVVVTPISPTRRPRLEDPAEIGRVAQGVLQQVLDLMGLDAQAELVSWTSEDGIPTVSLEVVGDSLGLLIGRHGDTLAALQFLLGLMVNRRAGRWVRVLVDIEGYRERRKKLVQEMALRAADRAQRYRQPVVMDPMIPSERRIIHLSLADHPGVTTHSIGEGDHRRVVVTPKRR